MFNSFSESNSNANAKSSSKVVNEIYDFKQIVRSNQTSKFKKVKIHSKIFDLMTCNIPCIFQSYKFKETKENTHENDYSYRYQEIQVLSFNQISKEEMLIEYLVLEEKEDIITIRQVCKSGYTMISDRYYCDYYDPQENEILEKIEKKLFTKTQ